MKKLAILAAIVAPVIANAQSTDPASTLVSGASTLATAAIAVGVTVITWTVGRRLVAKLAK